MLDHSLLLPRRDKWWPRRLARSVHPIGLDEEKFSFAQSQERLAAFYVGALAEHIFLFPVRQSWCDERSNLVSIFHARAWQHANRMTFPFYFAMNASDVAISADISAAHDARSNTAVLPALNRRSYI
jgi:hypothetical protein